MFAQAVIDKAIKAIRKGELREAVLRSCPPAEVCAGPQPYSRSIASSRLRLQGRRARFFFSNEVQKRQPILANQHWNAQELLGKDTHKSSEPHKYEGQIKRS